MAQGSNPSVAYVTADEVRLVEGTKWTVTSPAIRTKTSELVVDGAYWDGMWHGYVFGVLTVLIGAAIIYWIEERR